MRKFYYYTPIFLQKVGFVVFFTLFKTFLRVEVKGREHLKDLKRPVILAANHTSELDVMASPLILGFFSYLYPIYYVSDSKEKFKSFGWRNYIYGGIFFNVLGGYSINSGHKNYAISLENHLELLKQKHTILIFPEGKRTLDGSLNPARGGLGYMVYDSKATVVPVAIDTFFNISWMDFLLRRRKVRMTILKPILGKDLIKTKNPSVEDYQNLSNEVLSKISNVLR